MSFFVFVFLLVAGISVWFLIAGRRRDDQVATAMGVLLLVVLALFGVPAAISDDPPPQRPVEVSTR